MALYAEDAMKICPPEETVARAESVIRKYDMVGKNIINYEFRNKDKFGVWASALEMAPELFYEYYPDEFPYLKGVETFWFRKVSGKGLHQTQCAASMFMEFFERLSIEFMIHKSLTERTLMKKGDYIDYMSGIDPKLGQNVKYLFSTKPDDTELSLVDCKDLVTGEDVKFSIKLLFLGPNGYAAGNEMHEAMAHGIFEVVERYTQTMFVLKAIGCTRADLESRTVGKLYSFDPNIYDELDKCAPFVVDVPSLVAEYPDLEEVISNLADPFDKFEIVDVSMEFNGVKFYSYLIRQGVNETGFKLSNASGCHFDQRIAIIRALTEASQGYTEYEKLNQAWNGYLFTRHFADKVFNAPLPTRKFERDSRIYTDMEDVYNDCVKAFDHIICADCTCKQFGLPVLSLYIPQLYSKSFIWSLVFCTTQLGDVELIKLLGEDKVPQLTNHLTEKSISGVESLFFMENYGQLTESMRSKVYYLYLAYTADKDLTDYVLEHLQDGEAKNEIKALFDAHTEPEISTTPTMDDEDEDSYRHLHTLLAKNDKSGEDYYAIVDSYARMGCLDYAVVYADKNGLDISEIVDEYLPRYTALRDYAKFFNLYGRFIERSKQLCRITGDETYLSENDEAAEDMAALNKRVALMLGEKDGMTSLFGLVRGDTFGGWTVDSLYQTGEYVYRMTFTQTGKKGKIETMNFKIAVVRYGEFRTMTDNGYYLEFAAGLFDSAKKKLAVELIKRINALGDI